MSCPVTWVELADVPRALNTRLKPVRAVPAAGLTPIFPAVRKKFSTDVIAPKFTY